jgi:hypothetical protein
MRNGNHIECKDNRPYAAFMAIIGTNAPTKQVQAADFAMKSNLLLYKHNADSYEND